MDQINPAEVDDVTPKIEVEFETPKDGLEIFSQMEPIDEEDEVSQLSEKQKPNTFEE